MEYNKVEKTLSHISEFVASYNWYLGYAFFNILNSCEPCCLHLKTRLLDYLGINARLQLVFTILVSDASPTFLGSSYIAKIPL